MSAKRDLMVGGGIVMAAAAVVAILLLRGSEGESGVLADMAGHQHAAPAASVGGGVALNAEASRRIGVVLTTVERRPLPLFVQAVGIVVYDETRLATVNPKIEGWVEALDVDFTGAPVSAGEPLLEVYSPMLVSAQEELILAARIAEQAPEGRARQNAGELLESARRRLAYWDIPADEIRRIEQSGEPTKTLTLRAPASGIVVEKNVVAGDRIMPGMTLYRIADLSRVWIEADVFEKDLALVARGQSAMVTFEAFPGRTFSGRVTYVYPTVSMQSRTARIRLELPNPEGTLRPGMYAKIDFAVPPADSSAVVPRGAVIETGERTLVFVQAADGALYPRQVTVGRASGQFTQILDGVAPGERVVSSAAFLIDAESNLGTMAPASPSDSGTQVQAVH